VAVKEGVVTLSGFVHSYFEKDAAEKAAKRVYGVKTVGNDIEVRTIGTRTDPEIAREVVQEIQSHVSLPAEKIKATVEHGWVKLEGTVDWQYQKTLAESAVKKLRGVIGVTNNIEVKPVVTPTEIKSKLEDALKRSAELDARRIAPVTWKVAYRLCAGRSHQWTGRVSTPSSESHARVQIVSHGNVYPASFVPVPNSPQPRLSVTHIRP
jgi:osmotically-inducible protein OsmY